MNSRTDSSLSRELRTSFPDLDNLPPAIFAVGGAIRDLLLDRSPLDVDLACKDARAIATEFASRSGGRFVELGGDRFITFRVVISGRIYDFNEMVGDGIEDDIRRRDFTVNAIALETASGAVIDPMQGRTDMARRLVRMVREENFRDDPLRVLKGVRLAVTLDFTIEPVTLEAMRRYASALSPIAPERVGYELDQIFSSPELTRGLVLLNDLKLDSFLFGFVITPELVEAIAPAAGTDTITAYGALFFHHGAEAVNQFAARWRWSERQRKDTLAAIEMAHRAREITRTEYPILIYDYGLDASRRAVQILYTIGSDAQADQIGETLEARGEAIAATAPLLTGERIQAEARIGPGPQVGRLKRAIVEAQLRGEITSSAEALDLIRRLSLQ